MKRIFYLLLLLALLQPGDPLRAETVPVRTKTFISEPVTIDQVYKSMRGPFVREELALSDDPGQGELLWLKSVKLEFIDGKDKAPRPMTYLCHSHILQPDYVRNARFSLIQGQNVVALPGNLGVPAISSKPLKYVVQVLNLHEVESPFDLRVKTTLDYVRDADVTTKMRPLYEISLVLKIPIDEQTAAMIADGPENCHASLPSKDGSVEVVPSSRSTLSKDSKGDAYSYHWNVPPGKHTYSYDLQRGDIQAGADAVIHYATMHVHPYARSVELWDLTTNSSVLTVAADNFPENGAIKQIHYFYSEEGLPFNAEHQYQITTTYDNPTEERVDAMAMLYLYLYDRDFDKARSKWDEAQRAPGR